MFQINWLRNLVCMVVVCISLVSAVAEITWSGDIDPADPTTWTSGITAYIGITASGTLDITGDSDVLTRNGYIGYGSDSQGEVTVDGIGSGRAMKPSLLEVTVAVH